MKLKKFLVFVSALVLVFGLNATSAFAATGVWTIDGVAHIEGTGTTSTNNVSYFNNDASNYCYSFWSQDGTDEGAQISQTVEITEAGTYTLSFYYMGGPESNGPISVVGFIGDTQGESQTSVGWIEDPEMWDLYTVSADLEPGTYEVGAVVDISSINAWGDLDNFTLTDANGTEYLVKGDFGFTDEEWATYVVSNVQGASTAVNATDGTDATGDTSAAAEDTSADTAEDTSADTADDNATESASAAQQSEDEGGISTGVVVAVVIVVVLVAVFAIALSKKNKADK